MKRRRLLIVATSVVIVLAVACSGDTADRRSNPPGDGSNGVSPTPALAAPSSPTAATPTTDLDASNPGVASYAEATGVSIEEATRRLALEPAIGALGAQIEANEAETFAGLWIDHDPEDYRVIVRFTERGEETIRPYVANTVLQSLVHVREARWSLAELRDAQNAIELPDVLRNSGINVFENRVELYVSEPDVADVRAALASGALRLPEPVVIVAVPELAQPAAGQQTGAEDFPLVTRAPVLNPGGETAQIRGTIEVDLDRGCVWLTSDGRRFAVIWPAGTTATLDPFELHLDGIEGGGSAREGDHLSGGGGYASSRARASRYGIVGTLDQACVGAAEIAVFNHYDSITVTPRQ